jgi:hypothetical protein
MSQYAWGPVPGGVNGGLTDAQLRATPVPVSGTVTATGPLTDTQLRATPVPVSGTVTATGPLTDTQLRATAVPVSGPLTDTQLRATPVPVSGAVSTGGLTDAELRAIPVPVSGTVTATGPLTDTQLRATPVPVSGPLTDTQLRATPVPVSGTVTATGPLTDTQLRATPVPVSGTVTANAGTNLNTSALALETTQTANGVLIGAVTETAPATDTASSGLNGRLQRIAQRLSSILADTATRFGTLGQKTMAGSAPIVIASDQASIPVAATLQAGSAIAGKVGIDQTTPGTTNGVQVNAALPAGANSIGQVTANAGTNLNTSALALEATQLAGNALTGAVNETAPATDIASSGLNGRLQRIAQNLSSILADTATRLGTLGQKTMTGSAPVVLASNHSDIGILLNGVGDSAAVDAFGRLRASTPKTLFSSKLIFDNQPLIWDDAQTSGSGTTSTHSTATASVTMSTTLNTAGTRVRQTKQRFNYQSGKSQLFFMTGVIGAAATGITKRIGAFDESNGAFFESNNTGLRVVYRSKTTGSVVDTAVLSSSWNVDKMDGTGVSGITLLPATAQIFVIDYAWLGVGRIRFGIMVAGKIYYVHTFSFGNVASRITPWASTPNFPVRYEIANSGTGAAVNLIQICASVSTEGGQEVLGFSRSITRGNTKIATVSGAGTANLIYPIVGIRLKSTNLGATVRVSDITALVTTTADCRWVLLLNPTVAGADAASWTSVSNSSVEYDVSRNNTNTLTGGTELASGYLETSLGSVLVGDLHFGNILGSTIAGVADQIVLGVQPIVTTASEDLFGGITFDEDY